MRLFGFRAANGLDGINDLNISGASTNITCNGIFDFYFTGIGIFIQQRFGGQDHAG